MDAYLVGNLVGRLVLSSLFVFAPMLVCSCVNVRTAIQRMKRWYGIGLTLMVFVAGLAAAAR